MTHIEADTIQTGWSVWTSDGKELGTVIAAEPDAIRVKTGGLLSKELLVAKTSVEEVETGRVEIGLTKSEVEDANRAAQVR